MNGLPSMLCSDEALRPLVGFRAHPLRHGVCQGGTATQQSERTPGLIGLDTLAHNMVKRNVRDLEAVFTGAISVLAKAGVFGAQVPGTKRFGPGRWSRRPGSIWPTTSA
jgi:hypothetical protein